MSRLTAWWTGLFSASDRPIERQVALYPGRFQPFARNHFTIYNYLKERFDDVVIVTQGRPDPPRSPFDFEEKLKILAGYGIPAEKAVAASMLRPRRILRQQGYHPRTTMAVIGLGGKDQGDQAHFEKLYAPYESHRDNLLAASKRVYFSYAPTCNIVVDGKHLCGTMVRESLGRPGMAPESRRELFRECFGWFDEEIFRMVVTKLGVNEV